MNSVFEKYKWLKYVIGSFVVGLGVLVIILACVTSSQTLQNTMAIVISIAAFIFGLVFVLIGLLSETHKGFTLSLLFAALCLTAGIVLLIDVFHLKDAINTMVIVYSLVIFVLVFGAIALAKAISLIVYKERKGLIFLFFVVAILAIVLGILGLVFGNKLQTAAYIILGILVLVAGILIIVFSLLSKKKKEQE